MNKKNFLFKNTAAENKKRKDSCTEDPHRPTVQGPQARRARCRGPQPCALWALCVCGCVCGCGWTCGYLLYRKRVLSHFVFYLTSLTLIHVVVVVVVVKKHSSL